MQRLGQVDDFRVRNRTGPTLVWVVEDQKGMDVIYLLHVIVESCRGETKTFHFLTLIKFQIEQF